VVVADRGTAEERAWLRREGNRSHKTVRSDSPVAYNAFDPQLQMWVAACVYKGFEDLYSMLYGPPSPELLRELYPCGARFGTTLQVPEHVWPPDRDAFEDYWNESLGKIQTDEVTRPFLRGVADLAHLPAPIPQILGPLHRLITVGFLPEPFRDELGYDWTRRQQTAFNLLLEVLVALNRLPKPIREFPFNLCHWDFRRRMRNRTNLRLNPGPTKRQDPRPAPASVPTPGSSRGHLGVVPAGPDFGPEARCGSPQRAVHCGTADRRQGQPAPGTSTRTR